MTGQRRYTRTPPPPAGDTVEVRLVGTPAQVELVAGRLGHVVDIVSRSPQRVRRDEPGQVQVYLRVRGG